MFVLTEGRSLDSMCRGGRGLGKDIYKIRNVYVNRDDMLQELQQYPNLVCTLPEDIHNVVNGFLPEEWTAVRKCHVSGPKRHKKVL